MEEATATANEYQQLLNDYNSSSSSWFTVTAFDIRDDMNPLKRRLTSTVYSGPTLVDIQNALSVSHTTGQTNTLLKHHLHPRISPLDKGLNKNENKYTLKINTTGIGMADDGYKWRKYGQKFIKNSPNPRSYYKCTNPKCNAKKQVERSIEDPETLFITYEGLHLHFAYPYFFHSQPQQESQLSKKVKKTSFNYQEGVSSKPKIHTPSSPSGGQTMIKQTLTDTGTKVSEQKGTFAPQGLLEDLVPIMVRNPSSNDNLYSSSSSSYSSSSSLYPSSPSTSLTSLPYLPIVCDLG